MCRFRDPQRRRDEVFPTVELLTILGMGNCSAIFVLVLPPPFFSLEKLRQPFCAALVEAWWYISLQQTGAQRRLFLLLVLNMLCFKRRMKKARPKSWDPTNSSFFPSCLESSLQGGVEVVACIPAGGSSISCGSWRSCAIQGHRARDRSRWRFVGM